MSADFDVIIAGAGLAGLTAGLALSRAGFKTALLDARDPALGTDPRTSALAASSVVMLRKLGLGEALAPHLQPINDIMIGEGRPGNISPLTLHFDGTERRESQKASMAYIVENSVLKSVLLAAVKGAPELTLLTGNAVTDVDFDSVKGHATVSLGDKAALTAPLIIAADGRGSFVRRQAAITVDVTKYNQHALITTVSHEREHGGVAHQMFLPGGPFAILPLPGKRASIVWSDRPEAVAAALALDAPAFHAEISRRFGDHLGALSIIGPNLSYPLSLQLAEHYTAPRLALIGDAAHVVHPMAGQGLNMGLRDVAALVDVLSTAKSAGLDLGGAELANYALWRRGDNRILASTTDRLNALFLSPITPLRHIRRLGLAAIDRLPAAQNLFISEAAGETGDLPSLLRA